ncbi:hypothetical protein [Solicola sp. PLA-1-18]|uniref:hypothetical protein n=1 Tax=Solicola sp. PLA-1-18 TaxID=3380532 RepID=UPI003B8024A1
MTSSTPSLPRSRATVVTVVALLATLALALTGAAVAVAGPHPDASALRHAAVLTGGASAAAFGVAAVLVVATRRLVPGLWGYVPGVVCLVASSLAVGAV